MPFSEKVSIVLRPAVPEDEDFLFQLFVESRASQFLAAGLPPQQLSTLLQSQFSLRKRSYAMQYPLAVDRIALDAEGRETGRLLVAWDEINTQVSGNIVDIAVLASHQRRGIGSAILDLCIAEARQRCALLRLSVDHGNPARDLYLRHGFLVVGDTELQLRMQMDCR